MYSKLNCGHIIFYRTIIYGCKSAYNLYTQRPYYWSRTCKVYGHIVMARDAKNVYIPKYVNTL